MQILMQIKKGTEPGSLLPSFHWDVWPNGGGIPGVYKERRGEATTPSRSDESIVTGGLMLKVTGGAMLEMTGGASSIGPYHFLDVPVVSPSSVLTPVLGGLQHLL